MRRILLATCVLLVAAGGYVASPLYAAWSLREAIKAGDTRTLERKVVWDSVRQTLRASIASNAQLLPEANKAAEAMQPTVWQRVKSAFGSTMLDRFVESYVTPEGLPKLFQYRKTWNGRIKGQVDEDTLPVAERVTRFYSRIKRAEFRFPTMFEIEMVDQGAPDRRIVSTLELIGFEWKLTALRVLGNGTPGRPRDAKVGDTGRNVVAVP